MWSSGITSYVSSFYNLPPDTMLHCINNATIMGSAGITINNSGFISHCINNGSVIGVNMIAGIASNAKRYHLRGLLGIFRVLDFVLTIVCNLTPSKVHLYYSLSNVIGLVHFISSTIVFLI